MNKLSVLFMRNACMCLVLLLSVASCTKAQDNPKATRLGSGNVATKTALLATIADDDIPPPPPVSHSEKPDPQLQQASFQVIFSESGRGVAYLVQKGVKLSVVHNQNRGKEYSAVGTVVISADGQRIAYAALANSKWCMVVDGKEGKGYETLLTPVFSPDGRHMAYLAKEGDKWYLVVDNVPNAGTLASYTTPEFSSDSSKIVYIETAASSAEMKLIISDLMFQTQHIKKSIGDLLFILNKEKTHIVATQVVGKKLRVIDFSIDKPDLVREGTLYDLIERLTINDVGDTVAYCALRDGKRLIVMNDKEEALPKGLLPELPIVRPDKKGLGLLLGSEKIIGLYQAIYSPPGQVNKYDEAAGLLYSEDSRLTTYAARKGDIWFIVVNGKEGPAFDKVVAPQISPDGKHVAYRARKDGKRFVVISDTFAKTVGTHPVYEQIFDVKFTGDGNSVAYGVKDGRQLIWKVVPL